MQFNKSDFCNGQFKVSIYVNDLVHGKQHQSCHGGILETLNILVFKVSALIQLLESPVDFYTFTVSCGLKVLQLKVKYLMSSLARVVSIVQTVSYL